jgi:hypothetical protein
MSNKEHNKLLNHPSLKSELIDFLEGNNQYRQRNYDVDLGDYFNKDRYTYQGDVLWTVSDSGSSEEMLKIHRNGELVNEDQPTNMWEFFVNDQGLFLLYVDRKDNVKVVKLDFNYKVVSSIKLINKGCNRTPQLAFMNGDHILIVNLGPNSGFVNIDTKTMTYTSFDQPNLEDDMIFTFHKWKVVYCSARSSDKCKSRKGCDSSSSSSNSSSSDSSDEECGYNKNAITCPADMTIYQVNMDPVISNPQTIVLCKCSINLDNLFYWNNELYGMTKTGLYIFRDEWLMISEGNYDIGGFYSESGEYVVSKGNVEFQGCFRKIKMTPDIKEVSEQMITIYSMDDQAFQCDINLFLNSGYQEVIVSGRWRDDKVIIPFEADVVAEWINPPHQHTVKSLISSILCNDFICNHDMTNNAMNRLMILISDSKQAFMEVFGYDDGIIDKLEDLLAGGLLIHRSSMAITDYQTVCSKPSVVIKSCQRTLNLFSFR